MEASRAAILASVEPVVAAVMGLVIFGEPVTLAGMTGIGCVITAVLILNVPKKEKAE